jgi:adenine deaminase
MPDLARRLAVARGDELADVVVEGAKVFSVFTREWLETEIAIRDGYVAGLGEYAGKQVVHARGKYVVPGFVDAHMHLESSKLSVDEFARLVLPMGTTPVVADPHELEKLALRASHVDGHAPGVLGKDLQAYAAAGIRSDHEVSTLEEARERLRAGMWVLIREASAARNLEALLPLVEEFGPDRLAFCTDDREPEHIAGEGHMNSIVRAGVVGGVSVEDGVVMA